MERKAASSETVRAWIRDCPDLSFNGIELWCKVCDVSLSYTRKTVVLTHVTSKKHLALLGGDKKKRFNVDLLTFMVGCNIPWRQLDNPVFREFIENCVGGQYAEIKLPSSTTLRKDYLPQVAENVICKIRSELDGKYIWVSVDETTNACGWKIANVLVGALEELHATRGHLLASKVLESADAVSVSTLVSDSLRLLWGNKHEENKDKFLLYITDIAGYMKLSGRMLQGAYNFLHVTCLVHTLHRVAETVKECYPKVDKLISSVKKVFHKAPEPLRLFCEILPDVELPPEPIEARWSTWIEAATYYFIHLGDVKQVLQQLDPNQAVAIADAQEAVMDPTVESSLQEIHNFFSRIPLAIQQLERDRQSDDFSLIEQMNVVYDLRHYISLLIGESAERVKHKLETILESNPGFHSLSSIVKLLCKEEVDFANPGIHEQFLHKYELFRHAPITSVDIERSFSVYKWIFSDKRRRLSPAHLEQLLIINFYYNITEYRD